MAVIVSVGEVRALIKTSLPNNELQLVIDRVTGEITRKVGAPQETGWPLELTENLYGVTQNLYVRRPIYSITSITEDEILLDADYYRAWSLEGRIQKLPAGGVWGEYCEVVYKPALQTELRKQVTIDIIRVHLERTAMMSEGIGEYSYSAPKWDSELRSIIRKLMFPVI